MQPTNHSAAAELAASGRRARFCREIAAKVGGKPTAQPAALQHCVERVRSFVLSDRSAFIFNVSAAVKDGRLVLRGECERPEFVAILRGVFRELGFSPMVDRVEVVPDPGKDPAPFAVVVKPGAMAWPVPELRGIAMDQALLG